MNRPVLASLLFALSLPSLAAADPGDPDEPGCKDSPVLTRFPGCRIHECETVEFDEHEVTISFSEDDDIGKKALEGAKYRLVYECPERASTVQLARNASNALKKAGFQEVFFGKVWDDKRHLTYRKGDTWVYAEVRDGEYEQSVITVKEMDQEMTADADALQEAIEKSGRVAVYGIEFDTGKASIQPASEKVLAEIVTLLQNNPDWKMTVEGHTDNVGKKALNQKLSEQRAAAVVAWLAKKGIDKGRLTAKGYGDSKPVGDNATDAGRQQNRRVELVKN